MRLDDEAAALAWARLDRAADERDALAQADETVTAAAVTAGLRHAVVRHLELQLAALPADGHAGTRGPGVLEGVRQRLLDHAVRGEVDARRELHGGSLDDEVDGEPASRTVPSRTSIARIEGCGAKSGVALSSRSSPTSRRISVSASRPVASIVSSAR